jgi:hypothetical protein
MPNLGHRKSIHARNQLAHPLFNIRCIHPRLATSVDVIRSPNLDAIISQTFIARSGTHHPLHERMYLAIYRYNHRCRLELQGQ